MGNAGGNNLSAEFEATRRRILNDACQQSAKLFEWQSPAGFSAILDALDSLVADYNHLVGTTSNHREPVFKASLEGWVLKHFFEHLGVRMARLVDPHGRSRPDAELEVADGSTVAAEVTEAITKFHDPSLRPEPGVYPGDQNRWRESAAEIPGLLERAAQRKAKKSYAEHSRLLIYLHAGATWGRTDQQIEEAIATFQARYIDTFAGVYVLWGDKVY